MSAPRRSGDDVDADEAVWVRALGDGRPALMLVAWALFFAGGFAMFLALTGDLLPQDVRYLGMTGDELREVAGGRVHDFMVHDRIAFGGTLLSLGIQYAWLTAFPLRRGEAWAWWTWLVSGIVGFASFLGYIGYGYLDTWHGVATLLLLPVFVIGIVRSRRLVVADRRPLRRMAPWLGDRSLAALGRAGVVVAGFGAMAGGFIILRVGLGDTFVPEDLEFMDLTRQQFDEINPRLIPLLTHDRVGFAGGIITSTVVAVACAWYTGFARHFRQQLALAGLASVVTAIAAHFYVGYTDPWHLTPAVVASIGLYAGLAVEAIGCRTR